MRAGPDGVAVVDVAGATDAFAGLADALLGDVGRMDFLRHLTRGCAQLVQGRATAVMLTRDFLNSDGVPEFLALTDTGAGPPPRLQVCATSSSVAARVASLESRTGHGPCWQALATRHGMLDVNLHTRHEQWPDLVPAALAAGIDAMSAFPLYRSDKAAMGVLAVYHAPREVNGVSSTISTRRMTDVAVAGLLTPALSLERELLARQLYSARRSRNLIDQAASVLAARAKLGLSEAATQLQQQAQLAGMTLTAMAAAVIDNAVAASGRLAVGPSRRHERADDALGGLAGIDRGDEASIVQASCNEVDFFVLRLFWVNVDAPVIAGALGWNMSQLARRMADIRARLGVSSTAAAVDAAHRLGLL